MYYPPDGTGRDTYIIKHNGGTCNDYAHGAAKIDFFNNDFLRDNKKSPFHTPKMNSRLQDIIPSMKTYNNWPSKEAFFKNREM